MRKVLKKISNKSLARLQRRKLSVRKKISGTSARPRIVLNKSNKHLSAQAIDDTSGVTIAAVSTFGKNAPKGVTKTVDGAKVLGMALGELLAKKNVTESVYDRAGYKYTGIVSSFVNGVREKSIKV